MKSTKLLTTDHELILEALHVLDEMNTELQKGKNVNRDDIRSLLTFLREFADGCHHVKEEAIFFPALIQAGMALEDGPLQVMTYEHERARSLAAAMQDAIGCKRMDHFVMYSGRYVKLMSDHIEKENWVLFDRADQILSDDEDQKIADAFEHYDTVIAGAPTYERLRHTIEGLASKYLAATAH